jgi:hypothetical protein
MQIPTKIPTLLGLILVIIMVSVIAVGSETFLQTRTRASGSIQPANVTISNVSDTTFTVSWTTPQSATGALSVTGRVLFDDQDTKIQEKYTSHIVTFRGATAGTSYDVTIISDGKKSLDGDKPYTIRTAPALTTASGNLEPAYGTIIHADKSPVKGALVYVTLDGSQTLSAITKPSGTWLIPLNLIRTQDLSSFLPVTERMNVNLTVTGNGLSTTAITDTLNSSPVPDMMLGKTYDFRKANAKTPGAPIALNPASPAGNKSPPAVLGTSSVKAANTVTLTIPAQGAALPTTLPLIQGTGIPGRTVSIVLGITRPVGGSATVGSGGLWSYTPVKPLSPGGQSVTITTKDANNKAVAITHLFTIFKSGTQVLGDATPSATLTPTITLPPVASDTATPTPESTLAAQEVPTSGNTLPTIILLLLGIGLMMGGGVALIK